MPHTSLHHHASHSSGNAASIQKTFADIFAHFEDGRYKEGLAHLLSHSAQKELLQLGDERGNTLLHQLSGQPDKSEHEAHYEVCISLVQHGASLTTPNRKKQLPVHLAAIAGNRKLCVSLAKRNPSTLSAKDERGRIPEETARTTQNISLAEHLSSLRTANSTAQTASGVGLPPPTSTAPPSAATSVVNAAASAAPKSNPTAVNRNLKELYQLDDKRKEEDRTKLHYQLTLAQSQAVNLTAEVQSLKSALSECRALLEEEAHQRAEVEQHLSETENVLSNCATELEQTKHALRQASLAVHEQQEENSWREQCTGLLHDYLRNRDDVVVNLMESVLSTQLATETGEDLLQSEKTLHLATRDQLEEALRCSALTELAADESSSRWAVLEESYVAWDALWCSLHRFVSSDSVRRHEAHASLALEVAALQNQLPESERARCDTHEALSKVTEERDALLRDVKLRVQQHHALTIRYNEQCEFVGRCEVETMHVERLLDLFVQQWTHVVHQHEAHHQSLLASVSNVASLHQKVSAQQKEAEEQCEFLQAEIRRLEGENDNLTIELSTVGPEDRDIRKELIAVEEERNHHKKVADRFQHVVQQALEREEVVKVLHSALLSFVDSVHSTRQQLYDTELEERLVYVGEFRRQLEGFTREVSVQSSTQSLLECAALRTDLIVLRHSIDEQRKDYEQQLAEANSLHRISKEKCGKLQEEICRLLQERSHQEHEVEDLSNQLAQLQLQRGPMNHIRGEREEESSPARLKELEAELLESQMQALHALETAAFLRSQLSSQLSRAECTVENNEAIARYRMVSEQLEERCSLHHVIFQQILLLSFQRPTAKASTAVRRPLDPFSGGSTLRAVTVLRNLHNGQRGDASTASNGRPSSSTAFTATKGRRDALLKDDDDDDDYLLGIEEDRSESPTVTLAPSPPQPSAPPSGVTSRTLSSGTTAPTIAPPPLRPASACTKSGGTELFPDPTAVYPFPVDQLGPLVVSRSRAATSGAGAYGPCEDAQLFFRHQCAIHQCTPPPSLLAQIPPQPVELKQLVASGMNLSRNVAQAVLDLLFICPSLTKLDLSHNRLSDGISLYFAAVTAQCGNSLMLHEVLFDGSLLSNAAPLADVARHTPSLSNVSLQGCRLLRESTRVELQAVLAANVRQRQARSVPSCAADSSIGRPAEEHRMNDAADVNDVPTTQTATNQCNNKFSLLLGKPRRPYSAMPYSTRRDPSVW